MSGQPPWWPAGQPEPPDFESRPRVPFGLTQTRFRTRFVAVVVSAVAVWATMNGFVVGSASPLAGRQVLGTTISVRDEPFITIRDKPKSESSDRGA